MQDYRLTLVYVHHKLGYFSNMFIQLVKIIYREHKSSVPQTVLILLLLVWVLYVIELYSDYF